MPLAVGFLTVGWSPLGVLFATAWFLAYPASYYAGRSLVTRYRRGSWTARARREAAKARWWLILLLISVVPLVVLRPWLLLAGLGFAAVWVASLVLTTAGRERGLTNDGLLVLQSASGVALLAAVTTGAAPAAQAWWGAGVCAVFFAGSVLHVKSHIRESGNHRWSAASRMFSVASLLLGLLSPWLLLPFSAAAVRAFAVPDSARPAMLGGVEAATSLLVVIGWGLALSAGLQ